MAECTAHLPEGPQVRTRSTFRFVVWIVWATEDGWRQRIQYRTDRVDRARHMRRRHNVGMKHAHILDTHTKEWLDE